MADGGKMDFKAHEGTYARFIGLTRTAMVVVVIIVALVVLVISR